MARFPLILLTLLALTGCFRTSIHPHSLTHKIYSSQWSQAPTVMISCPNSVGDTDEEEFLGYLYLLPLPLMRIYLASSSPNLICEMVSEVMFLRGYNARIVSANDTTSHLSIGLTSLRISAYDLLFLRLVRIGGTLTLTLPSGETLRENILEYHPRSLPFAEELALLLRTDLKESVKRLLDKLPRSALR